MERGVGTIMVLGNIFFTIISTLALLLGGWSGVATVSVAAGYFILSTSVLILTSTGGLRDILLSVVEQSSRLVELMILISHKRWMSRQMILARHHTGDALEPLAELEIMPQKLSDYRTFVSPVPSIQATHEQAAKAAARAWLIGLFDERTGELDGTKVYLNNHSDNAGRLWERVPVGDARALLLSRQIIKQTQNGYALNLERVGTLRDVDSIM